MYENLIAVDHSLMFKQQSIPLLIDKTQIDDIYGCHAIVDVNGF